MITYLTIHPSDKATPMIKEVKHAHMAYTIKNLHLLRGRIASSAKGGAMVICDIDTAPYEGSFNSLSAEIYNECLRRNFDSVVLDLSAKPTAETGPFAAKLCSELCKTRIKVHVPYLYSVLCPDANYIVSSSISGGSLREHLSELSQIHGNSRLSLEIERIAMDFNMPSSTSESRLLACDELKSLMQIHSSQSFYSSELCSNYFTYSDSSGNAHFVLFDDARSIADKINLANSLAYDSAFIIYHQIRDIIPELISYFKS